MPVSDNLRGILLMCASMAAFTINDTFMKSVTQTLPLFQTIGLRGLIAVAGLLILALALPTNVMPVINFFGLLGAGVATLSVPTSLIGCVALGIAVDDTCHFLQVFRKQRAQGVSAEDAALHCIVEVGRPMVVTSIMLVAGFLVMLFSSFATLREFGYLTAITMGLCLATDVGMLPALLVALSRLSEPRGVDSAT